VYYQACTRVVGGWWQSVVIVTATGSGHYVAVNDFDENWSGSTRHDLNSKTQADGAERGYQ
jgi:hypothetical protein